MLVYADGIQHAVQVLVLEAREVELLLDAIHHATIFGVGRITIIGKGLRLFSFQIDDGLPGYQIHLRAGGGKIQVFAPEYQGWAGRPDMDLTGTALV